MSTAPWLRGEREALASEHLLDAAGRLFAEHGVPAVTMAQVATAAGCSRATLYRYFENRDQLRRAFVHRETRRIAAAVAREIDGVADGRARLVRAMAAALALVRADPTLGAWFSPAGAGTAAQLAGASEVIEGLTAAFLGDGADGGARRRARWVVRILVSLLVQPEPDPDEERRLLEDFVAPVVLPEG